MGRLCAYILILCISGHSIAQEPAYFRAWQDQFEGVHIYDIIQDNDENYWFATNHGLYKHDGYRFEQLQCSSMIGNSLFTLTVNDLGQLFCQNLNGQVFKIENNVCELFFTLPKVEPHVMMESIGDDIVIMTSSFLYKLDSKANILVERSLKDLGGVYNYLKTSDSTLLIHGGISEWILILENNALNRVYVDNQEVPENSHLTYFKLEDDLYAIETSGHSVYKYDTVFHTLQYIGEFGENIDYQSTVYTNDQMCILPSSVSGASIIRSRKDLTRPTSMVLQAYFISCAYQDHENNILLGTFGDGVLVIPSNSFTSVTALGDEPAFYNITSDKAGSIYLGTRSGKLIKYDSTSQLVYKNGRKSIEKVFVWKENQVFSDADGLILHNVQNATHTSVGPVGAIKGICILDSNQVLIGANNGLRRASLIDNKWEIEPNILNVRVYNMCREETSGYVYVSTAHGTYSYDPEFNRTKMNWKGKSIHLINAFSYNGKTYLSTQRNGIFIAQNGVLLQNIRPEFKDEPIVIYKLIISNHGIYANTQEGLMVLDADWKVIKHINKSCGVSSNKIKDFTVVRNALWVVHSSGVQHINLDNLHIQNRSPKLSWLGAEVNGKPISLESSNRSFDSGENDFRFSVRVATLKNRQNIRYHYKLKGANDRWYVSGYDQNNFEYNSLSPGTYTLIVKAENNGVFSEPLSYTFTIASPYYQRWWFYVIIACLFGLIIAVIYRVRIHNVRKMNKAVIENQRIEKEMLSSKLKALRSQMNPHFIFNSLNAIQDLVLKEDTDNAYDYIVLFADLVRNTLNYSNQDFIPIEKELEFLDIYLSLEKLRFKETLTYSITYHGDQSIKIPSMIVQPFVENALLHGLLHKDGNKHIDIAFQFNGNLTCNIKDNGIGRKKANEIKARKGETHRSFSIKAIEQRLKILEDKHQISAGFVYTDLHHDKKPIGTMVEITIPYEKIY